MKEKNENKKATFILDGGYLVKASYFKIDYLKLKKEIQKRVESEIADSVYFNSKSNIIHEEQSKFFNFLKAAEPNGPRFEVKLSNLKQNDLKCPNCNFEFHKSVQKGVDVAIAIKMVEKAFLNKGNTTILLAGDGDFIEAIHFIKNHLKQRIIIVGFRKTMSVDLQSIADQVVFLDDLKDAIAKQY